MDARLLGPLELNDGATPIALGAPAQRALLARLLLDANRTVAVGTLVEDSWGEDVPGTAAKMVQIYVSRLRKVLPAGVLVTRPPGYAVQIRPEAVDLVRFDRLREHGRTALVAGASDRAAALLREALALWRGPALAEFDEPFAAIEARRLEELRLTCLEERIEADLALGRHAELIGELDALVTQQPLRERPQRQLMLALYRAGRQADALAVYRRLHRLLAAELGLEPSPELRALERRILAHDPALGVAALRRACGPRDRGVGIHERMRHAPRRGCISRRPT